MSRLIAIGDVHGELGKLDALLDTLSPAEDDTLVFLGDYIDRGPDSPGVIERLLSLGAIFLRGNHEQMCLDAMQDTPGGGHWNLWTFNGGDKTFQQYTARGGIPEKHHDFICKTWLLHVQGRYVFVHAGLDPSRQVAEQLERPDLDVVLWERRHLRNGRVWSGEYTVVCGHTPLSEPYLSDNLIAIDTGSCFGGKLTAIVFPEGKVVQVA